MQLYLGRAVICVGILLAFPYLSCVKRAPQAQKSAYGPSAISRTEFVSREAKGSTKQGYGEYSEL
jgi:hypothetical protein